MSLELNCDCLKYAETPQNRDFHKVKKTEKVLQTNSMPLGGHMAALPIPPRPERRAARLKERHQKTHRETAQSLLEWVLAPSRRGRTGRHRGKLARQAFRLRRLAGKQPARGAPYTHANRERHRKANPAETQAANLEGQGLSKPRLPGTPLNRSPRRGRRKMGN